MRLTEQDRELEIANIGLTSSLLKLANGEYVHDDLEFRCNKPKYYLEPENFSPKGMKFIPLWEVDDSVTGFYHDSVGPTFIVYYIDEIDNFKKIGSSVKDLIEYLVIEYGEDEAELRNALSI